MAQRTRPREGERENGDRALFELREGRALFAVVDGLGHGPKAAEAAMSAERVLREAPPELSVVALLDAVHVALRGTRGAAASLLLVRGAALEAAGVGNVGLRLWGAPLSFLSSPGVLGGQLRKVRSMTAALTGPARLVLWSDGISSRFDAEALAPLDVERAAEALMSTHGKTTDDATLLIADL